MVIKIPYQLTSYDVDMIRYRNSYDECVLPRRLKRNLPTLPEDKECSSMERKSKLVLRKRRQRRQLRLPALPENDEN